MQLFYQNWNLKKDRLENSHLPLKKIVLLHGMGGTGALWRPIARALEDSASILAPDQRGHGKSQIKELNAAYAPVDYAHDVLETLATASFHPAWIIGHSMGVRTAVAAAFLRPHWVKGLVLIDLGLSERAGGGFGENLKQCLSLLPEHFQTHEDARSFLNQHSPDISITQYLLAVLVKNTQGHFTFPFDKKALLATLEAVETFSLKEWIRTLGDIKMPIYLLRGSESKVWSEKDYLKEKESFSDRPSVHFEQIEGAGHGLPFEKKSLFLEKVRKWIFYPSFQ